MQTSVRDRKQLFSLQHPSFVGKEKEEGGMKEEKRDQKQNEGEERTQLVKHALTPGM